MADKDNSEGIDGASTLDTGIREKRNNPREENRAAEDLHTDLQREAKRRKEENDGGGAFTKAQPELCDDLFSYTEKMEIIPGVGFWEPYLLKVSRKYLNIGVVIACFDDVDRGFEDMNLAAYGLVREVNLISLR